MANFSLRTYMIVLFLVIIAYGVWASEPQFQSKQVILTTADGVKIRAFEIATGKDTMLIYCHRLLSSKESFDIAKFGNLFLREFDVLAFDFRGHKESEWISNCGGDEVLDLRAAIGYARETGHQKIVLLGVGMGGIVAIREVALFGNADAVVAVSPCAQPENLKPWWWNLATDISLTTNYGKIPIHILSNTRISDRYWTGSPVYLIDRVSPTPLLLVHGQDDRYLNLEQIQTLYDIAKEPKKLLILPQSEHAEGLLDEPTAELIINWLKEVLSNQSTPPCPSRVAGSREAGLALSEGIPKDSSESPDSRDPAKRDLRDLPSCPFNDIDIHGDIVLPEKMIENTIKVAADDTSDFHGQLIRIKKEVEALHKARGYTLSQVSEIQLSTDGQLSLRIEVGKIDHLTIDGNNQITSEQIQQVIQIAEGHYYNAWEIETAVKRLNQFPVFANVENQLKQDVNGNTVKILVKERRPWALGLTTQFTDSEQFGGIQFSLNEFRSGAWRGFGQILFGLNSSSFLYDGTFSFRKRKSLVGFQHRNLLYRMNVEKGWFRQEALSIGFGFEQFIHSWDNLDYYFARQEAQERGGVANIAYKITDNATIHFGVSRKRFTPPQIKAKGESGKAKVKTFDLPSPLPKGVRGLSTFDFFEGVDSGFINALALRLENRGRFLRRGESFFNWRSQAFVETATTLAHGDYDYTIFQFNVYPQLILSPTQSLNFGLHWGHSRGDVPRQKLFSLGGDATLPGYDDDAFVGEHVFLLRAKYDLNWGKWLGDTSRMAPLGVSFLFDAGDARMKSEPLKFDAPKFELGVELNYNSLIRLGFVKSLGKERTASARSHPAKRGYFYFGWHPHLIRP